MTIRAVPPRPPTPGTRTLFARHPVTTPFETSVRALAAMGGPMLVAVLFGRPDLGTIASVGTLATPFIGFWTYPQRARRLSIYALVLAGAYCLGELAAGDPVARIVLVGAWAALASLVAGTVGTWAGPFGTIAANVCIIATGLTPTGPPDLSRALLVLAGALWTCGVFCVGWRAHRWDPEIRCVSGAYQGLARYLAALGTPGHDSARIIARQQVMVAWDAVGPQPPVAADHPTRIRLFVLLQHAQRLLEAAVSASFRRPDPVPAELPAAVRALSLTTADPELANVLRVPEAPPDASAPLRFLYSRTEAVRRDAAVTVPELRAGPTPLRETLRDRLEGMRAVRAVQIRVALRLGIAVAFAQAATARLPLDRGYWVALTTLLVMQADPAATQVRAVQRAVGTVLGVIAMGSLLLLHPQAAVSALAMCAVGYLIPSGHARTYVSASALLTAYALLMIQAPDPAGVTFAVLAERVLDTVLGGAIAVTATFLLWPHAATRLLPGALAASLQSVSELLRQGARAAAGTSEPGSHAVRATDVPARARRVLLLRLLNLRALFDRAAGERPLQWPSTDRMWPAVVLTLRLGVMGVTRAAADHTQPLLTIVGALGIAQVLHDLAEAVAAGRSPHDLPWVVTADGTQSPIHQLTEELHSAVRQAAAR